MHDELAAVAAALQVNLPGLEQASATSQSYVKAAKEKLLDRLGDQQPLDIVLCGSIAREEASPASDFDYLVVAHGLLEQATHITTVLEAARQTGDDLSLEEPGRWGLFGRVIAASDIVERIGLEEDTNFSHSRRVLTMLESASVYRPDLRASLLHNIVQRYLADHTPGNLVPRFLLNDVLRYWRTMTVDYQAKLWADRSDDKWGSRYLKLIISRKLTVAGTITSLFRTPDNAESYLVDEFNKPPLARLAALRHVANSDELREALTTVFCIADAFTSAMASDEFRSEVSNVTSKNDPKAPQSFLDMVDQGRLLQSALERLFFDSDLSDLSRTYLSF